MWSFGFSSYYCKKIEWVHSLYIKEIVSNINFLKARIEKVPIEFWRYPLRIYLYLIKIFSNKILPEFYSQLKSFLCIHFTGKALYQKWIVDDVRHLLHILEDLPTCKPPVDHLLELLPRLQPRFYSIASSAKVILDLLWWLEYFYERQEIKLRKATTAFEHGPSSHNYIWFKNMFM